MLSPETETEYTTPFAVESETEIFFHGGHWGQCLELLSHLCQYSDSILLVTGPAGIGKSSLKKALMLKDVDRFSFCEVQATSDLNAENLMARVDATFEEQPLNNDLVFLIDDAENLSLNVIMVLLQLKRRLDMQRHMQIVLFASPDLEQKMLKSVLKEDFSTQVHMIELEPLTLAELEAYLTHQWRVSGKHGSLPFDKATFKKLYTMSGGIPGKLQNLSREFLTSNKIMKSRTEKKTLSPVMVGSIVSLGLLFCLLAFLWPDADDSHIKQPATKIVAIPKPELTASSMPSPLPDPRLATEPEQEAQEPAALSNSALQVAMQHEEKIAALEKKVNDLQQSLAQEREGRRNSDLKPQPKVRQQKVQKPIFEATKEIANYSKDEKYIMGVPSQNYTLQLLGAGNETKIKQFIKDNNLSSKAHYFKSIYQGKPWFIVIYGNYATRASAISALDRLPAHIRKLQPWPREYTYIQGTIRKN